MEFEIIYSVINYLGKLASAIPVPQIIINSLDVTNINEAITRISKDIELTYPLISQKLENDKKYLFRYTCNDTFFPDPVTIGHILACLNILLDCEKSSQSNEWGCIHPLILRSSQKLYKEGNYAEAAVNAFIEINARVKKLYIKTKPGETNIPDGVDLICKVFPDNNPLVEVSDISDETGANIHNGTRFMLMGAMKALRNPKSHSNEERTTVTKEEAMRRLMFASLLMYKIDDAVKHSHIKE